VTKGDLLSPLAALYGAAISTRLSLYERGVLKVRKAGRPVLSIGNVAAGGTGKTPFLRWLAGGLLARGLRPSIVTRGYGRRSVGPVVVSDGAGTVANVRASGDEALVLARALPRVPILADARRGRGARRLEALCPDIALHLLDDGFSHVSLARDLDIVLLDATAPDAGGALLPKGRLREPLTSLARADIIVVTKIEQADPAAALEIARIHAPGAPVYHARTNVLGITDDRGETVEPTFIYPGTAVAVAGLARPEAFFATLASLGIEPVTSLAFRDHHPYGDVAIGGILREAEEAGATAIVTTEKDAVKLEGRVSLPIFRVAIEMRILEKDFLSEVLARLKRQPS